MGWIPIPVGGMRNFTGGGTFSSGGGNLGSDFDQQNPFQS